ncbi:MAG: hypothetical protein WC551_10120 [Patescibacteria group bacterium]
MIFIIVSSCLHEAVGHRLVVGGSLTNQFSHVRHHSSPKFDIKETIDTSLYSSPSKSHESDVAMTLVAPIASGIPKEILDKILSIVPPMLNVR